MSRFSAEWLELRERYDRRARNPDVLAAATAALAGLPSLAIVDLACGTGATARAIAPHLARRQHWRLVDNDLGLLARVAAPAGCTVEVVPLDLVRDLEAALDGAVDLVAATALLDLVSAEWLDRLVMECAARRLPLYAALSYDGRVALVPADPLDAAVIAAFDRHQRTDKGFGAALGPRAAATLVARSHGLGYAVTHGRSDWVLGPADGEVQVAVLTGWQAAAREVGELAPGDLDAWLARRREAVDGGRSSLRIGHRDVFARPIGMR